jgi:hypothetical protein
MNRHTYPSSAMIGDYLRSIAGLVPATAILAIAAPGPVATGILVGLAALFALFGLRTGLRHMTRIEASETGLAASGPLSTSIRWAELDCMKLAYYSTRRDRRDGWMQLELRADASTIRLDSRIAGFAELVERAARAAATRELELSAATIANLAALGIGTPVLSDFGEMAGGRA